MTTPILPQTAQTDNLTPPAAAATLARLQANSLARRRALALAGWREYVHRTIFRLRMFDEWLAWLQAHPGPVTEEAFNDLLGLLADAGLLDWADGSPRDATRPRPRLDDLARALGLDFGEEGTP